MLSKRLTLALIAITALLLVSCSVQRTTAERLRVESSGLREVEARDSLREEILQNLNENLTEHEVVTETVIFNDSLKIERITLIPHPSTISNGYLLLFWGSSP